MFFPTLQNRELEHVLLVGSGIHKIEEEKKIKKIEAAFAEETYKLAGSIGPLSARRRAPLSLFLFHSK